MADKTISFIMPCHNDGNSIEKAITSIRDQDLPDIEMIVVNDGSTDESKTVLEALKEKGMIDHLIHFEQNRGACVARNEGAKLATGKYFSFLPADAVYILVWPEYGMRGWRNLRTTISCMVVTDL